jgi:Holliday junction resolvase RusA-like endonuclease
MNRIFSFAVEGKPPVKRRPRGSQHYTPKATVEDEDRVRQAFRDRYETDPRSEEKFAVTLKIFTNRNVDGDNIEKAILDALIRILWENDRQVKQMNWEIAPVGGGAFLGEHVYIRAYEL